MDSKALKILRLTGLYQILDPNTAKIDDCNIYHIVIVFFASFTLVVSMLFPMGFIYLRNDIIALMFYVGCISNFMLCCFKVFNILYYSKDIWKFIDVTKYYLTLYKHYNTNVLKNWQTRSTRIMYLYIIIMFIGFCFWFFSPHILNESTVTIRNIDGSYGKYRLNIFNLYLIVSDETYNMYFYVFYVIEIIMQICFLYFTIVCDIIMILISFEIISRMEIICIACGSLNYNIICSKEGLNTSSNPIKSEKKFDVIYDDLKIIITDHKTVIRKLKEYYTIFRPVTIIQIFITSSSHIIIWFVVAMNFGEGDKGNSIITIKLFAVHPLLSFQLYMMCYLFGSMNEKKDSIIFALYSSNWTEMDIKCKKMILLAMKMNNANHLKMKFTNTKIVNKEMFTQTIRFCYSIFSMMVNYNYNKTN